MSLWQMPQASTLILTWSRVGSGMFLSTSSKLPPALPTWTAFIFDMGASSLIRGNMERKNNNEMCEETARTQGSRRGAFSSRAGDARRSTNVLDGFLQLSLEGVLGAVARLGEIAIGTVLHGVGVTVPKLIFHGVVAGLGAFVRLEGTLPTVGVIVKM